jgi:alkylation response protein AidB-like acyl-CoA dehydrogenase
MDFTFSEDQLLFRDSVKDFLQGEVTPEKVRASWELDTGRDEQRWQQMVELGLTAMLVPEVYGGIGMNEIDFVLLAVECGRVALPEPLVTTALVVTPMLSSLAGEDERCGTLLQQIAAGEAKVSIAHTANDLISDAHIADWLILPYGDEIHLVAKADVELVDQPSVDPARRLFSVSWEPSEASRVCTGPTAVNLLAAALNRGALGVAAQMIGLAEAMVDMTVQYTTDRLQFGKPIGTNQALKHHMANCAVKIEFSKPVVYRAAYTLTQNPAHADFAVSHAKVSASEAALLTAKKAIQCHGAMGYTWECDLQIFMKRAWGQDKSWGHNGFHKNRLHQWLLNPNALIGADKTFGEQA